MLLLITSAFATQTYSPTAFNGHYTLSCSSITWTLSASLAGYVGGTWTSGTVSIPVDADCDGIDVDTLADDTYAACAARGLSATSCTNLAATFGEAAAAFNEASVGPIPDTIDLTVGGTGNWFNKWIGVYPMTGAAGFADGSTRSVAFLVNNNDGGTYGNFSAGGIALSDGISGPYGGCTTVGTAAINGDLDRGTPYALDATGTASASLLCGAGSGGAAVLLSVSLSYTTTLTGTR